MRDLLHNFDRTVGIIIVILSVILFWQTFAFQTRPYVPLNTGFWPRVILTGMAAIGLILIIRGRLTEEEPEAFSWSALICLAAAGIFLVVMSFAGFLGASILLSTGGFIWLSDDRGLRVWLSATAYGLMVSGLIYVLFRIVLKVQFPMGVFG